MAVHIDDIPYVHMASLMQQSNVWKAEILVSEFGGNEEVIYIWFTSYLTEIKSETILCTEK